MSLASTRVSLPHKCLIERSTQTNDGAGGIYDDWSTLTEGVSCKAWAEAPQSVVLGDRVAESEGRHVIVPPEVDINPGEKSLSRIGLMPHCMVLWW